MRIAIVNWSRRKEGGAESSIDATLSELCFLQHQVAFVSETDVPAGREWIAVPGGSPQWCASYLGIERTLAALRSWKPAVVYCHGLLNPRFEAEILRIAPAVFYAHSYYGTCISGTKSFGRPAMVPCNRRFGWGCFFHYHVRRCGGLNPLAMRAEYRRQAQRLRLLRSYRAILVASEHMRLEYLRHGFPPCRVHTVPIPIVNRNAQAVAMRPPEDGAAQDNSRNSHARANSEHGGEARAWRLLFVGRMTAVKGGAVLLDSLAEASRSLGRPLRIVFAGDGPERARWEAQAGRIQAAHRDIDIRFSGWVSADRLPALFLESDLLVVPSLWPEPFGMVGPEAALCGVPAAAFNVGGNSQWLIDGFNGRMAPANPPTAEGFAEAIVKCLRDPAKHALLRRRAGECASRFSLDAHMSLLMPILAEAAERMGSSA
jgi:glycosyltransferase involved in cell wall biosynthesis